MEEKRCICCGGKMQSIGEFSLQKGRVSVVLGYWDNIAQGALDVRTLCCEKCRKLDFYLAEDAEETELLEQEGAEDAIPQVECPFCGAMHDLDDAICPHCRRRLMD